mmetsp:Transcript_20875/g.62816  ORF Transcript_20875/g.62816 Transcript_20875/m.62816 type:complete len:158 (-) Transcript_20875:8-481(-)
MSGMQSTPRSVMAADCNGQQFQEAWPSWCNQMMHLLSKDRPHADKREGWAGQSHVFCRLASMADEPGVRRDAAGIATQLAPMLLQTLLKSDSGGVCEAALRALAGVLTVTPAALRNHEPALTAAVAQLLLSPAAPAVRRQAALCFALLPHVRGTVGT